MTIQLSGQNGTDTEIVLYNVDTAEAAVIDAVEAADGVEIIITIAKPDKELVEGLQKLQREDLGFEDEEEGPDEEPNEEPEAGSEEKYIEVLSRRCDTLDGLGAYAKRQLKGHKFEFIWQLVQKTEADLLRTKNIGRKTLRTLTASLRKAFAEAGVPQQEIFNRNLDRFKERLPKPEAAK